MFLNWISKALEWPAICIILQNLHLEFQKDNDNTRLCLKVHFSIGIKKYLIRSDGADRTHVTWQKGNLKWFVNQQWVILPKFSNTLFLETSLKGWKWQCISILLEQASSNLVLRIWWYSIRLFCSFILIQEIFIKSPYVYTNRQTEMNIAWGCIRRSLHPQTGNLTSFNSASGWCESHSSIGLYLFKAITE